MFNVCEKEEVKDPLNKQIPQLDLKSKKFELVCL